MESERERLKPFRRALSKEDQDAFDRLFDRAKMHTSAGVYRSHPWQMETILPSICLEHGKMIEEILGKLKEKADGISDHTQVEESSEKGYD
jgi:AMMECR1 domain-containing protein